MKRYKYKGFTDQKEYKSGTVEAPSGEKAILKLFQNGIRPINLEELSSAQISTLSKIHNLKKIDNSQRSNQPSILPSIPHKYSIDWMHVILISSIIIILTMLYVFYK